ncbi:signal peptidase I [Allobaculum mucilyticum]|uniref:signal peptidase I n=1 Tax=Allobaculum mucilyticum TaxID=2834459 RepID=UPI001E43E282|nr:signal peptidase I [Allobaculum mucilyticum]UNT97277.1 signal peptidase I [Allobaculum mucilyticum]
MSEKPRTKTQTSDHTMPSISEIQSEIERVRYRKRYWKSLKSILATLITAAAVAVLISMLWMPVLEIYGPSMAPTLQEGDIVAAVKNSQFETGDVVAFYYNNKILVKRVMAGPGDWIDLREDGTVYVNGEEIDEPYLQEKAYGNPDIEFPYQVPEGRWFVMGDHRSVSKDSRNSEIGPIAKEDIVGKLVFRLWPNPGTTGAD